MTLSNWSWTNLLHCLRLPLKDPDLLSYQTSLEQSVFAGPWLAINLPMLFISLHIILLQNWIKLVCFVIQILSILCQMLQTDQYWARIINQRTRGGCEKSLLKWLLAQRMLSLLSHSVTHWLEHWNRVCSVSDQYRATADWQLSSWVVVSYYCTPEGGTVQNKSEG